MLVSALLALALVQASKPADPVAQSAERQRIALKGCTPALVPACPRDAVLIANGQEGVCTDAVLPSGLFTVGEIARQGYLTRAKLVAEGGPQLGATTNTIDQPSDFADTALLITMDGAGPQRLCVPLTVALAGQRFRVEIGEKGLARTGITGGAATLRGSSHKPEIKGLRVARAQLGTGAYLLGPNKGPTANSSAVRALGDYLFGTGTSALVSVTISSNRPKPVLLDGIVRGQTNMSFRVALVALDRLMIRDGAQTIPLTRCRAAETDSRSYIC